MDSLIERLKAATEGSRQLDAEIAVAVRDMVSGSGLALPDWADHNFPNWRAARAGVVEVVHDDGTGGLNWKARRYTSSIDVALTLVPEGWWLKIRQPMSREEDCAHAFLEIGREPYCVAGVAPTIPLALCIAALLASIEKGDGDGHN